VTGGECTIRSAEPADVAAAGELWQVMADQHSAYDAEAWCYRHGAKELWCEEFARFLDQADKILLVAEDGGEIVGVAVLAVEEALVEMAHRRGIVREVIVAESARGRGVATKLMDVAFDELRARRAEEVVLHAALDNAAAVGLYEKLGMRRVMYRMYRRL